MRNDINLTSKIISLAEKVPCFTIENLMLLGVKKNYLRIFLSRKVKSSEFLRLKRGLYISKRFIENEKNKGRYSGLLEFLTSRIYSPSYLSMDYVLYQHNILTEIPVNFTLVTRNKTKTFSNPLGNYVYHNIKDGLFFGYNIARNNDFVVYKASKMKALFDFLYLRKNFLRNKKSVEELRLNLEDISLEEKKKLGEYIEKEGSKAMCGIYTNLFGEQK